jgi:hypothetical protein
MIRYDSGLLFCTLVRLDLNVGPILKVGSLKLKTPRSHFKIVTELIEKDMTHYNKQLLSAYCVARSICGPYVKS